MEYMYPVDKLLKLRGELIVSSRRVLPLLRLHVMRQGATPIKWQPHQKRHSAWRVA